MKEFLAYKASDFEDPDKLSQLKEKMVIRQNEYEIESGLSNYYLTSMENSELIIEEGIFVFTCLGGTLSFEFENETEQYVYFHSTYITRRRNISRLLNRTEDLKGILEAYSKYVEFVLSAEEVDRFKRKRGIKKLKVLAELFHKLKEIDTKVLLDLDNNSFLFPSFDYIEVFFNVNNPIAIPDIRRGENNLKYEKNSLYQDFFPLEDTEKDFIVNSVQQQLLQELFSPDREFRKKISHFEKQFINDFLSIEFSGLIREQYEQSLKKESERIFGIPLYELGRTSFEYSYKIEDSIRRNYFKYKGIYWFFNEKEDSINWSYNYDKLLSKMVDTYSK